MQTQARREKRRTVPAPVAPPVISLSTLDQFDATSKRRESKRQQVDMPELRSTVCQVRR